MRRVAISPTGLYIPPESISNQELVTAFNQFAESDNKLHAAAIAAGTRPSLVSSSLRRPQASSAGT